MLQDILAVASTEFELTQQTDHLCRYADHTNFTRGVFASAGDFFVYFFLGLFDNFFDAGRVYTPIFHEHLKRGSSDLATNWIETTEDDHAWRVVNHDVDASGTLQGLYIAAFFAYNAAFHLVVSQLHSRHGTLGRDIATHTLHSTHQYGLGALFGVLHGIFLQFVH